MRSWTIAAVCVIPVWFSPTSASGITFGDWATAAGFRPGDVMPAELRAHYRQIDGLDRLDNFDWTTTPTTFLCLQGNRLSTIAPGDFRRLTNLRILDLSANRLESLHAEDLGALANLTDLRLGGNQFAGIISIDFSGLTNLKILDLPTSGFSEVQPGDFVGLTSLTNLNLGDNRISDIRPGDFSGLPSLTNLNLSVNQLRSLRADAFNVLPNLTSLGLHGNQFNSIRAIDFTGLTNLRSLRLGSNRFSNIEPGDFSGLTNLIGLHLLGNPLTCIEPGAFRSLKNLKTLDLGQTALAELDLTEADLSSLGQEVEGGFPPFGFFNVSGNDFTRVSLKNAVLYPTSLETLIYGGQREGWFSDLIDASIGDQVCITELDLSGVDFAKITDLAPLYVMDDLTDLWLAGTVNFDPVALDIRLDNLATIEGTEEEGVLYMTKRDFDAWNTTGGGRLAVWDAESGHHVAIVPEPAA
jgi:hypothetical protein